MRLFIHVLFYFPLLFTSAASSISLLCAQINFIYLKNISLPCIDMEYQTLLWQIETGGDRLTWKEQEILRKFVLLERIVTSLFYLINNWIYSFIWIQLRDSLWIIEAISEESEPQLLNSKIGQNCLFKFWCCRIGPLPFTRPLWDSTVFQWLEPLS